MKSGARDQIEGAAKELKGAAKQKIGRATGDAETHAKGTVEKTTGRFQQKTGQIKRAALRE